MNISNHIVYIFDEFRLDTANLMLYRDGEEIPLPPKAVETLIILIEDRGKIIGKDELMDRIWTDSIVEESNLSQYLYQLRKTLGNRPDGKPYIETFRRRGYRFNGEVQVRETSSSAVGPPSMNTPPTTAAHYDVERRGNVLKLVDRKEAEIQPAEEVPARIKEVALPSEKRSIVKVSIIAFTASLILISVFFYFRQQFFPPAEPGPVVNNELTFVRLTNGSAPMEATISVRGDHFVYHEQDGATAHLWLQQTGQSNRIEIIPPTQKIMRGKTFSPDGRFVYFVAQDNLDSPGALYRVPTLGGSPVKVLDKIGSTVSFSPDGQEMVFQRADHKSGETSLIIADSAGGGEKTLLTWTKEQGMLGNPAWSPDGSLIAFNGYNFSNRVTIYTINFQNGMVTTLSPEKWDNCYRMAWTRDGAGLVFVGTKASEGYSTRRDQIYYLSTATGEARRLTTDGNRHQLFSLGITDADEIIAVPFNRSSQIWQMDPNGDSRTAVQITNGLADGRAGLAALPDGRITYIARVGENLNVWTANADGTNQKQLTYDPSVLEEVRASPDGRFLVFSAHRDGFNHLFQIDADGANLRQLTFGENHNIDSTISPDGNWIVYTSQTFEGNVVKTSLQKIPSSGGEPVLLSDLNCMSPNFSPDGKFISCVYDQAKFVIISAEDGTILKTFEPVKVPYFNIGARWSPDGSRMIYIARRKNFSNLWQQPVDGGKPQPLTDFTNGELHNFAFSSDGSRLYIARGFEVRDVMLIKNFR